jgi:Terminase DNA packaging enzyme
MSKFDDKLSEILDVPVVTPEVEQPKLPAEKSLDERLDKILDNDLMKDYDDSRRRLKEVVTKGADAIDDILAIARESEHPRAFEVAAKLIDSVTAANEKLITLQKNMKDIRGSKNQGQTNIGKAAIFVGSTAELQKMLKGEPAEKIIDGNS